MHPALADHLRGVAVFRGVLKRTGPSDLSRATPCAGWTVRELLAHQLGQDRAFTAALRGGSATVADWAPIPVGDDVPGPNLAALEEQQRVLADFGDPAERTIWMPEILPNSPLSATGALSAHLIDLVVHSWDLAAALGVPLDVDDDLVQFCLGTARAIPDDPDRRGAGQAFDRALPLPDEVGAFDEVLLRLGRDPGWRPPAP
ncbi:MAG TPA: TIGR03086 family metal-binding protein [Nakamurella sp.]|nr:TIGR03086 family metal-binding protein [Nakamurella sp.]